MQFPDDRRADFLDIPDPLHKAGILQVFHRQKPRKPWVGEEMPEGEPDNPVHGLDRVVLADPQFPLAAPDLLVGVEQHGLVEGLLVAEIVIEQPLVGLGPVGDGVNPGPVEALLAELVARRLQDRGFRLFRVARAHRGIRAYPVPRLGRRHLIARHLIPSARIWRMLRPVAAIAKLANSRGGRVFEYDRAFTLEFTRPADGAALDGAP